MKTLNRENARDNIFHRSKKRNASLAYPTDLIYETQKKSSWGFGIFY